MSLAEMAEIIHAEVRSPFHSERVASSVTIHSNQATAGSVFFALAGATTDGHRYIADAIAKGASAAVVTAGGLEAYPPPAETPLLIVANVLVALQQLAGRERARWKGRVIAIAGSQGKTMVKEALLHVLSTRFSCYASPGSFNSQLGVPLAILQAPETFEIGLFESSVSAPGEMERHAAMLSPDCGLWTTVGWAHHAAFGSQAAIAAEQARLFEPIGTEGWLLVPAKEEAAIDAARSLRCRVLPFGASSSELPQLVRHDSSPGQPLLQFEFPDGTTQSISVDAPHPDAIATIEAAVCAAHLLGMPGESIAAALSGYAPRVTRREIWRSPTGATVVNDTGATDPLSVEESLRVLRSMAVQDGRRIFLFGGSPSMSDVEAENAGILAARYKVDDFLLLGSANLETARRAFMGAGCRGEARLFNSAEEVRSHLISSLVWGDALLVKGPPGTGVASIARDLVEAMAPTRLYIDLKAIAENVQRFRAKVGPSTKILAMIKALGYGTDSVQLARELHAMAVDYIGVSSADEGVQLRRAGISLPILVMMCSAEETDKICRYSLTPVVYSLDIAQALAASARKQSVLLDVHLEVDTGMGRTGVLPAEVGRLAMFVRESQCLRLRGLMTHLPAADMPEHDEFTNSQLDTFEQVSQTLAEMGFGDLIRHASATSGAGRLKAARFDMVRIGIGLYGVYPSPSVAREQELVMAVALVSRIIQVQTYPAGSTIGYGRTFTVPSGGFRAAVIPAGYHDGIPWQFGNGGYVFVDGKIAKSCGRISMDSMVVDVTEIPEAQVGSEVLIFGSRGGTTVRPEDLAEAVGTIAYELLAGLGPRVQRIFLGR